MITTFLLGNGFDLNLGLKTQYRDFYKYYLKINSDDDVIKNFKKNLSKNLDNWSDLELELGKYSNNFYKESEQYFINLLFDIQDNLAEYLDKNDSNFNISDLDRVKAVEDLINFDKYLTERDRRALISFKGYRENHINVITFNYTKTFEKIYNWDGKTKEIGSRKINDLYCKEFLESFDHVHGTTTDNMILGVNDSSQILSNDLKDSIATSRSFIKTEMNYNAGTLRDERCRTAIEKADVFCIFGMSLGETDKYWWLKIGETMAKRNAILVIFNRKDEIIPNRRGYAQEGNKEAIKKMFLAHLDMDEKLKSEISKRIFVCLNSEMFKVKLIYPKHELGTIEEFCAATKLLEENYKDLKSSS